MAKGKKPRKKPEPIWTARNGHYSVECYDFQLLKKSLPPIENPEIIPFKNSVALDE